MLSWVLTLCEPVDRSPLGFSVRGILETRTLGGLPVPPPGNLPYPGIKTMSPTSAGRCFTTEPPAKPLRENGYMYMCGWVPLLFTWNYHNVVNQLYPNRKLKVKNKSLCNVKHSPKIQKTFPCVWCFELQSQMNTHQKENKTKQRDSRELSPLFSLLRKYQKVGQLWTHSQVLTRPKTWWGLDLRFPRFQNCEK